MTTLFIVTLAGFALLAYLFVTSAARIQSLADARWLLGLLAALSFLFGLELLCLGCLALLVYSFYSPTNPHG